MKNLILTILHSYDYPFIEPFVKSLRQTSFSGDLVVFCSNKVSAFTRRKLYKQGAILISYNSVYPFRDEYRNLLTDIHSSITINNYRFLFFLQYLLNHQEKYDRILITDMRDVVFQKNPFDYINPHKLCFFLEDEGHTFRKSRLNIRWSIEANGKQKTAELLDKTISCAGVVFGNLPEIVKYLKHIRNELKGRNQLKWGFDQGIHNGYVYSNASNKFRVYGNDVPFVATLGASLLPSIKENGIVVNSLGEPYFVIHQYDRHSRLFKILKRKFIGFRAVQKYKRLLYLLLP